MDNANYEEADVALIVLSWLSRVLLFGGAVTPFTYALYAELTVDYYIISIPMQVIITIFLLLIALLSLSAPAASGIIFLIITPVGAFFYLLIGGMTEWPWIGIFVAVLAGTLIVGSILSIIYHYRNKHVERESRRPFFSASPFKSD